MAVRVDTKELDEFCPRLFRVLDRLGLLPRQLNAKPTEFEKYPRLLFGSIQRYNDVEAGFHEWESRVLRAAEYRKEVHYPTLEALRQWMSEHAALFTNKTNMQHLKTSLYARVFQYLYPRRVLVNAFCQQHKGQEDAIAKFRAATARDTQERESKRRELEDWLEEALPASIEETIQKVKRLYGEAEWNTIVADARQTLLDHAAYYLKVLTGEEATEVEPESIEEEELESEEATND